MTSVWFSVSWWQERFHALWVIIGWVFAAFAKFFKSVGWIFWNPMHPVEVWWRAGGNWQLLFALSFSRYTSVSYTCLYTHSLDTYNSVDIIYDIYDILIFFADSSLFPGEIEGTLWEQLHSRQDGLGSFRKPRVTAEVTTDGSYTPENEHENGKKKWRCISNVSFRVCVCV